MLLTLTAGLASGAREAIPIATSKLQIPEAVIGLPDGRTIRLLPGFLKPIRGEVRYITTGAAGT